MQTLHFSFDSDSVHGAAGRDRGRHIRLRLINGWTQLWSILTEIRFKPCYPKILVRDNGEGDARTARNSVITADSWLHFRITRYTLQLFA